MALNIKNAEAEALARALAAETGESLTEAVTAALRERAAAYGEVKQLQAFLASLPDRDARAPDEVLGYDEHGLPR